MHYLILWESHGQPRKSWREVFVENDEEAVKEAKKECRKIIHIIRKDQVGDAFVKFEA